MRPAVTTFVGSSSGRTLQSGERRRAGGRPMSAMWQNLRFAVRNLSKNPGFAAVAILTLALGIGANTAIFSTVYSALLKPLPSSHPHRLVTIGEGRNQTKSNAAL